MGAEGLDRFIDAQAAVIDRVMSELARGRKETHWMWFVFPQLRGLGQSEMALRYGIEGPAEARTYAAHPVLGPRLRAACELVLSHAERPAETIMGAIDAAKLRSCATLFAAVDLEARVFPALISAHYGGVSCAATTERLAP